MDTVAMTSNNSRYTYNTIFSDICKTRFNHLVTRLLLITTVFEAICITLLSSKKNGEQVAFSIIENVLLFFPKAVILYFVSIFTVIIRKNYLHVNSLGYSSLGTQLIGQIFSFKFVVYQVLYALGSFSLALSMSDLMGIGVSNYTRWELTYYKEYVWLIIPLVYNLQHNVFDMDKLVFIFDRQFQLPQLIISSNMSFIISRCIVMSFFILMVSPIISFISTGYWFIGFTLSLKLFALSSLILYHFEFTNLAFNAHMTMGCLHKGKPISALSATPMETLITGLQSKKHFTKLTAFQELAYRATTHDMALRMPIYNNGSTNHTKLKKYNIWSMILKECLAVIDESNITVGDYLVALEQTTSLSGKNPFDPTFATSRVKRINEDTQLLFGNQPAKSTINNSNHTPNLVGQSLLDYSLNDDRELNGSKEYDHLNDTYPRHDPRFIDSYEKYNESILTRDTRLTKLARLLWLRCTNWFVSFFFPITTNNHNTINGVTTTSTVSLSLFEIWYLSKERLAEKLIPLPIYHAESIIAIMGFLINGIEEAPKGNVVASVGDVLKTLERSVGILGKYTDWKPKGNITNTNLTGEDSAITSSSINVISILYEFSISAFLEIVLKYNVLLNDVYLDDDVVRLSKWVLDMCEST